MCDQDQVQVQADPVQAQVGTEVWILDATANGDVPEAWADPYDGMEAFCRKYFGEDYARFHGNHSAGHNRQQRGNCWRHIGGGEWLFDDEGDLILMRQATVR